MRSFDRDPLTNDLVIIGRDLSIVVDLPAVLRVCEHVAKAILGEMVFAKNTGMPYFQTVWVGNPTTAPFEAAFRARIMAVPEVLEIVDLLTEQVGDSMQYTAEIRTTFGTGQING